MQQAHDARARAEARPGWLAELREAMAEAGALSETTGDLAPCSTDAGNAAHSTPAAVFHAETTEAVAALLRHTRTHGIDVAVRGAGHTLAGHTLTTGVVLRLAGSLAAVGPITGDVVEVGAGAHLHDLVGRLFGDGLRLRTGQPDYHRLTVGGVLSVGGISPLWREGLLIDGVRQVEVVTGNGATLLASPTEHREVFEAVLGGLGALGVITRAWLEVVPAAPRVQRTYLRYASSAEAFTALEWLTQPDSDVDEVYMTVQPPPRPGSGPVFEVRVHQHTNAEQPPPLTVLPEPASQAVHLWPYLDHVREVTEEFDHLIAQHHWNETEKLWDEVFLDRCHAQAYAERRLAAFRPSDWCTAIPQFVLVYPQRRSALRRLASPQPAGHSDLLFLISLLRDHSHLTRDPGWAAGLRAQRRGALTAARKQGGVPYPTWGFWQPEVPGSRAGAPWTHAERLRERWQEFAETVARHNGALRLNPGTGMAEEIRAVTRA